MAEQEIINHTKKVYKAWKNPHKGLWHKIKEIGLEIFIIVFAVSISIWLHNWNESRHNKHEAHLFLEGLLVDLGADTLQMHGDEDSYREVDKGLNYFIKVGAGEVINNDSLNKYSWILYNTIHFNSNTSRFEALKASGKLGIINNKQLLTEILNYYQSSIIYINLQNDTYSDLKKDIATTIKNNAHYTVDAEYDYGKILMNPEVRHTIKYLSTAPKEIADTYKRKIVSAKKIITDIQTELK